MSDLRHHAAEKVVVFRFCEGIRDGEEVRSDRPQTAKEAQDYWKTTWSGTVGRRFDVSSPNFATYQRYQVKSKYESGDEIHVTCEQVD
jgi:hypothetical protein